MILIDSPLLPDTMQTQSFKYARACLADSIRRNEASIHLLPMFENLKFKLGSSLETTLNHRRLCILSGYTTIYVVYTDLGIDEIIRDCMALATSSNITVQQRCLHGECPNAV